MRNGSDEQRHAQHPAAMRDEPQIQARVEIEFHFLRTSRAKE